MILMDSKSVQFRTRILLQRSKYYADQGLPDGSEKPGEALCIDIPIL